MPVEEPAPGRMSKGRRVGHWGLLLLAMIVLLELCASLAVHLVTARLDEPIRRRAEMLAEQLVRMEELVEGRDSTLVRIDPDLGWDYRPSFHGLRDTVNEQGLRRAGPVPARPGRALRVAAFGDSYVYGTEVLGGETWTSAIESRMPALEMLNYGVGGYGMDQAYLRYLRDGEALHPDVVLIGFAPVDLRRLVNVYRPFISAGMLPITKPRFVQTTPRREGLTRVPPPLRTVDDYAAVIEDPRRIRELGQRDWWYRGEVWENPAYDWSAAVRLLVGLWIRLDRRYLDGDRLFDQRTGSFRTASEAFGLQTQLADSFAHAVRERGPVPVFLFLPDRSILAPMLAGQAAPWSPLIQALNPLGVEILDATEAFTGEASEEPLEDWFRPGGHYSPRGSALVGEWVGRRLVALRDEACGRGTIRTEACDS